jgi:Mg/Co/Ni transporter MgtE
MIANISGLACRQRSSTEVPAMTTSQVRSPRLARSLLQGLVLVAALLGLAGVSTATARADAIDNAFLNAVKAKGINFASTQPRHRRS